MKDGRRSLKNLKLTNDQRIILLGKVRVHSLRRKLLEDQGDKKGACFHEGCMKMAQQILEEFV